MQEVLLAPSSSGCDDASVVGLPFVDEDCKGNNHSEEEISDQEESRRLSLEMDNDAEMLLADAAGRETERWRCTAVAHVLIKFARNHPSQTYLILSVPICVALMLQFSLGGFVKDGKVHHLSCRNWLWPGWQKCGLNGIECPSQHHPQAHWTFIRCPPKCAWNDATLQIWGGSDGVYTGDSRICVAAVHAGYVSPEGGCCKYRTVDVRSRSKFIGGVGAAGLTSLSRNAWFPVGFEFSAAENCWGCHGFQFQLALLVCVIMVLAAQPVASLEVLLSTSFLLGSFYLQLVDMKPRGNPRLGVSDALTMCINALLVGNVMLWWAKKGAAVLINPEETSKRWRHHFAGLFLPTFFIGIHLQWFARIPYLDFSLDASLFAEDRSTMSTLLVILIFAFALVVVAYHFWLAHLAGNLKSLLVGYASAIVVCFLTMWLLLPCFKVHVHHAVVAAFLWPGASLFQSKISLACCGFLCGMMVNAIVMWSEDFSFWVPSQCDQGSSVNPGSTMPQFLPWDATGLLNVSNMKFVHDRFIAEADSVELFWPRLVEFKGSVVESYGIIMNSAITIFRDSCESAVRRGVCGEKFCRLPVPNLLHSANYTFTWIAFGSWGEPLGVSVPLPIETTGSQGYSQN